MSIELVIGIVLLIGMSLIVVLQLAAKRDTNKGTDESKNVQDAVKVLYDGYSKGQSLQQQQQKDQSDVLAQVYKNLGELNKQLSTEVKQLNINVGNIQEIFHNPNKRGHFGEQQLKDIIESVLPVELFQMQCTLSNNTRVDCLVKLPDPPGPIGIDSKFPAKTYEDYLNADELSSQDALATFKKAVLDLIKNVAKKYIIAGETSEFALIFVPSEAIFTDIHVNSELSAIVEASHRNNVYIVSPNTLMAALNTIRSVVNSMKVQREARKVLEGLGTIANDANRLRERAEKFEKQEKTAMKSLGEVLISATKVHNGIRKLEAGNVDLLNGSRESDPKPPEQLT